ncbi:DNA polymerase III subunit epsilon [Thiohalobacter sp. COW1]|uniref:3'-5' exonuclease n=1 Tax=Thiohalobacter sp. COW1 TaxID=2795687 RepID=UPI001915664B|nr:3'-5' exonuclease [Thiohalobacter sp. COW1]BCO32065.1 DNA polymerase III subunit epsilon [Thiohalobacter sp. COW1]
MNEIFLDTETTGLGPDAEIVEIAIVGASGHPLLDTLVRPMGRIPAEATAVHGITADETAGAPAWAEIHDRVVELLSDRPVVIYNASYDVRLMQQTAALHGLEIPEIDAHCAMLRFAEHWGEWDDYRGSHRWKRLNFAAAQAGHVWTGEAHRALADALACRSVWEYLHSTPAQEPDSEYFPGEIQL